MTFHPYEWKVFLDFILYSELKQKARTVDELPQVFFTSGTHYPSTWRTRLSSGD
jgi:hypothetical protein